MTRSSYQVDSESKRERALNEMDHNLILVTKAMKNQQHSGITGRRVSSSNGLIFRLGAFIALFIALQGGAQATETVTYYYTNEEGTPLITVNAAGVPLTLADYGSYGVQVLGDAEAGPAYTGHMNDSDTGLIYMQQRYYDPAVGRFLSVDPVSIGSGGGENFNKYWYANDNPYRFIDPDGRLSRGTGFDEKRWRMFDKAQQSAAGRLEKASSRIAGALASGKDIKEVSRAFEKTFGAGSATPENMAKVASDMSAMAGALRDTSANAIPANGMSAQAMTASYGNMNSDVLAGVPTSGPTQVVVNLDHPGFNYPSVLSWGVGHETAHAVLGYIDESVNGINAYKYGSPPQQQMFKNLPTPQRLVNPDHLMDGAR